MESHPVSKAKICVPCIQPFQWSVLSPAVSSLLDQGIQFSNQSQSTHSWNSVIPNWPCWFSKFLFRILLGKMQLWKLSSFLSMLYFWKRKAFTSLPVTCWFHLSRQDHEDSLVCCFPLGFVHLVEGAGPCLGQVEVHSGEDWTPLSDGNFVLPTAHVICAELGCGTAGSVLGYVPFRESDGRVWAEEFRCKGEESKLQLCPRVPCPGGTCHHRGAAQLVCSGEMHVRTNTLLRWEIMRCFWNPVVLYPAYSEVQLITNGTSQCEGQVKMNISGRWRVLCASHWSLANANVVCRQLGCGVAISTPGGPHLVEGSDQISTARFHCSGAEAFLWSCPVTILGGPDCSHGNTASVICSGKREGRATGIQGAPGVKCPQE